MFTGGSLDKRAALPQARAIDQVALRADMKQLDAKISQTPTLHGHKLEYSSGSARCFPCSLEPRSYEELHFWLGGALPRVFSVPSLFADHKRTVPEHDSVKFRSGRVTFFCKRHAIYYLLRACWECGSRVD